MSTSSLLSISDVSVVHGQHRVLHDITLTVRAQDFLTIIGPNGAGKTTLLKVLLGLQKSTTGQVWRSPEARLAYMPQQLNLSPLLPLTVATFLKLAPSYTPLLLEEILDVLALPDLLPKPMHSLSGGERQRVLLARALLAQPNVLVLDEPAQNLDIHGQMQFYALLQSLYSQQRFSVVMVSHDVHTVMAQSHHVICLYHHICCEGKPMTIRQNPAFTKLFGDDAVRLLAGYHHTHEGHTHD